MATNDFQVFAGASTANVMPQSAYISLAARTTGFSSGIAQALQLNKVWRQSSIMSSMIGQFTANNSGQNSVDDGTTATLEANFKLAVQAITQIKVISPLNLYVSVAGNEANNGLSPSTAVRNINTAVARLWNYNFQGNVATINVAPGTYNEGVAITSVPMGCSQINFVGSNSSPGTTFVSAPITTAGAFFVFGAGCTVNISGFSVAAAGNSSTGTGYGILVEQGNCLLNNISFGQCGNAQVYAIYGAHISMVATNIFFSGANVYGAVAQIGSAVDFIRSSIFFLNNPSYSITFLNASEAGVVQVVGCAFSSSFTGKAFDVYACGVLNTQGAGQNIYPTATPGTVQPSLFGVYT